MKNFIFNLNIINSNIENGLTIKFKNLIKDPNLEKFEYPKGVKLDYYQEIITKNLSYFYLPQRFHETIIKDPRKFFKNSFFLIPLLKIKDSFNNNINYSFFKEDKLNNIRISGNFNCIGFLRSSFGNYSSGKINIGNLEELNNKSNSFTSYKNGFLILKSPDSNCAMLYYGLFCDCMSEDSLKKLNYMYYYYILFDMSKTKIDLENLSINLELDIFRLDKILYSLIEDGNIQHKYKINLNEISPYGNVSSFLISLKARFSGWELVFDIIKLVNGNSLNNGFLIMEYSDENSEKYYKDFKTNLFKLVPKIDEYTTITSF